jgi:hypothetical protein
MTDIRREVSRIVEIHLEEILDRTMAALVAEIPAVAAQDDDGRALVRASTRHASLAFLSLYADPETPARLMLDEARRATFDRAGEIFDRSEIIQIIAIARNVIFQSAREFVQTELGADPKRELETRAALESFLDELERDQAVLQPRDTVGDLLRAAEREEPDLA